MVLGTFALWFLACKRQRLWRIRLSGYWVPALQMNPKTPKRQKNELRLEEGSETNTLEIDGLKLHGVSSSLTRMLSKHSILNRKHLGIHNNVSICTGTSHNAYLRNGCAPAASEALVRFGWYGFNPGSTLGMHTGDTGAMAAQVGSFLRVRMEGWWFRAVGSSTLQALSVTLIARPA